MWLAAPSDQKPLPPRTKNYTWLTPEKLQVKFDELAEYDTARYELLLAHADSLEAYSEVRDRWAKRLNLGQISHRGGLLNSLLARARFLQRKPEVERVEFLTVLARCYGTDPVALFQLAQTSYWWLEPKTENAS